MFRRLLVLALVGVAATLGAGTASAATGADLAVRLSSFGGLLGPDIYYDVSVTNHGPQALASATVVVQLDPRVSGNASPTSPCSVDVAAATATCVFGPLAAGATAKRTAWVFFTVPEAPTVVDATATRAASSPADPNAANDSASLRCRYTNSYPGFPPYPYKMVCGFG